MTKVPSALPVQTPVPWPPALSWAPQSADATKIAKAAQDFEAMATGQLLQPMFDTDDASKSAFGGGAGEAAWKPILVQEIAKQIAAHGGLGLAKPIYDAMLRIQKVNPK
ncbi:MAG: rod-binding protein [Rhodopila sp.]|nr:rod-binding protein [Rhodopila sp.]